MSVRAIVGGRLVAIVAAVVFIGLCGASGADEAPAVSAAAAASKREFCFILNGSPSISTLAVDPESGALRNAGRMSVGAKGEWLSALAVHPSSRLLYLADSTVAGSSIVAFTIDPESGALTRIAGPPVPAIPTPVAAVVDHRGKFLYVASQSAKAARATISEYAIDAHDGHLIPVLAGSSAGSCATAVAVDPSDRFVYLTGCSVMAKMGSLPSLLGFRTDPARRALDPIANSPFGVGSSDAKHAPGGLAIDPSGKRIYAADVLGSSIWVFNINPNDGTPTALANSPFLVGTQGHANRPTALTVDSAGRYLYAAVIPQRSHAKGSSGVFGFAIDPSNGALKALAATPVKAGNDPDAVKIDPSGRILYVVNHGGSKVSVCRVGADGSLTPIAGSPLALAGGSGGANGASQIAVVEIR